MAMASLKVTILGCGTSVGVPALGKAGWGACDPSNPKNRRQRCALLVQSETTNILVDAGPDIRNQLLPHTLEALDAILITHTHADHIAGLDDVRTFYWPSQVKIPIYATEKHAADITARYPYLFEKKSGSPSYFVPPLIHHLIAADQDLTIGDIHIHTLHQDHGNAMSLGFIFNDACAYSTDVVGMPDHNFDRLKDIPFWIVEALRESEHQAHSHLSQTLEWIERVSPGQAYLTHLGLEADYNAFDAATPPHVSPAYDGLTFQI